SSHRDLPSFPTRRSSDLGFAELVAVPQKQLVALPEGMDVELGAHAEPLAVALHAVGLAQPAPGDDALVFGVGPIGLNVIVALRRSEEHTSELQSRFDLVC